MTDQTCNVIRNWFRRTGGGSLKLPTRWFEKPGDAKHELTSLTQSGQQTEMELDGDIRLVFTGPVAARLVDTDLVIAGFTHLAVTRTWLSRGVRERVTDEFDGGEVMLAFVL